MNTEQRTILLEKMSFLYQLIKERNVLKSKILAENKNIESANNYIKNGPIKYYYKNEKTLDLEIWSKEFGFSRKINNIIDVTIAISVIYSFTIIFSILQAIAAYPTKILALIVIIYQNNPFFKKVVFANIVIFGIVFFLILRNKRIKKERLHIDEQNNYYKSVFDDYLPIIKNDILIYQRNIKILKNGIWDLNKKISTEFANFPNEYIDEYSVSLIFHYLATGQSDNLKESFNILRNDNYYQSINGNLKSINFHLENIENSQQEILDNQHKMINSIETFKRNIFNELKSIKATQKEQLRRSISQHKELASKIDNINSNLARPSQTTEYNTYYQYS